MQVGRPHPGTCMTLAGTLNAVPCFLQLCQDVTSISIPSHSNCMAEDGSICYPRPNIMPWTETACLRQPAAHWKACRSRLASRHTQRHVPPLLAQMRAVVSVIALGRAQRCEQCLYPINDFSAWLEIESSIWTSSCIAICLPLQRDWKEKSSV